MLRAVVAALLLANIVFYTWSQGWLDGIVGTRSIGDREPERLGRQVRPEIVRVLPPTAASAASAPSSPTTVGGAASEPSAAVAVAAPVTLSCLEAGPFGDAALPAAQAAARNALPGAAITVAQSTAPGAWLVYMGRYADPEALKRKQDELKRRKVSYEELRGGALAPGLALGRFDDRAEAVRSLDQYAQQGIRTARVVELRPATVVQSLRIDAADPALVSLATGLKLPGLGKGFAPCAKPS